MGVFNEIKKVLFGASSVAKHSAEKATTAGKEAANKVGENLEQMGEQVAQKTGERLEKAKDFSEEIGGKVMNTAETIGDEVLKKAEGFWEKTKSVAEELGGEIIEKSQMAKQAAQTMADQASEKVKATQEDLANKMDESYHKTEDMADDILDSVFQPENTSKEHKMEESTPLAEQAKQETEDNDSIFDQLMNKAEDLSDKLKEKVGEDKAYEPEMGYDNAKGSLLDGQDDFFERAKRFADGDYHNTGSTPSKKPDAKVGDVEIRQNPDYQKPVNEGKVKGFEDLDGDGDEIIDDAIILDD
ncbi:MAG: hypothetical protein AAF849_03805 [Bacteroidota bacterium]